jgi:3-isopropylmalate/(R)-2-methylmalate dehydratase large subunit
MKYLAAHVNHNYKIYNTDRDYKYAADITYDVSEIRPQLAAPFSVDNVANLNEFAGIHIDQAYLGSCTGGRTEDFAIAAKILSGKKIHTGTRMILVPATRFVLQECLKNGYIQELVAAGATLTAPGCAACLGIHQGLIADGETCISSTNRNFPGRMGNVNGRIYLGSPASVATAALYGKITDPAECF